MDQVSKKNFYFAYDCDGIWRSRFIVPNTLSDGNDNPEGRLLNRRTKFKSIAGNKEVKVMNLRWYSGY